ncbi:MAG TPA: hypothetical protein VGU45_01640 [Microvirga sp.]|jgi:hypothetical protein|nr:hypothetical protein [Microvirga sp.]
MSEKLIQAAADYLQLLDEAERANEAAADELTALAKRLDEREQASLATALVSMGRLHRVEALEANAQAEAVKAAVSDYGPDARADDA